MPSIELFFDEPRLNLGFFSRRFLRFVSTAVYAVLSAAGLVFALSDITRLRWLGVLVFCFLGERLLHLGKAERQIGSVDKSGGARINTALYLAPSAYAAIEDSLSRALVLKRDFRLLFLKSLAAMPNAKEAFVRLNADSKAFRQKLAEYIEARPHTYELGVGGGPGKTDRKEVLSQIEALVKTAYLVADAAHEVQIEPRSLLTALVFEEHGMIKKLLELFSFSPGDLQEALQFGRFKERLYGLRRTPSVLGGFGRRPHYLKHRIMNRSWTSRPTPTLDKYGEDLTDLARAGQIGFLIGHDNEMKRLLEAVSLGDNAVLLVGEQGVGKSALVNHLALLIAEDRVPASLFDKRLVSLSVGRLTAGSASPQAMAGELRRMIDEILLAGNVILFIPDVDNLAKTSGEQYLSAADILLPAIKSRGFAVIGSTYPREYKQLIEPQSDFFGSFEVVRVEEVNEAEAVRILVYEALVLERRERMIVTIGAVKKAVELAHRYFKVKPLPGSALELLRESLAEAHSRQVGVLRPEDVLRVAERQAEVPMQAAGEKEAEMLLNLEETIHKRLIDQEEAVKAVARALREYRSGLSRRGGPIAAFLFVGPTGVGKTELAKILAKLYFGAEKLFFRFDMSEYQEKQSIYRFIGSADGSVTGALTEAVRQHPYCLVLLDEFEKTHPDILNLFLQVFDDGRLTDGLGRTVSFENAIIIATSNAHSAMIKSALQAGRGMPEIAEELKMRLSEYFRPELVNRFSDIAVFKDLSLDNVMEIARIQLYDLAEDADKSQNIRLQFDETAVKQIAVEGYNPVYGARPLRKAISDNIRSVLAEKILRKEIGKGNTIRVEFKNSQFEFLIAG